MTFPDKNAAARADSLLRHPSGRDFTQDERDFQMDLSRAKVPHRFRGSTLKLRFYDKALQFFWAFPVGHVALFTAAALYVLLTQDIAAVKTHWDSLLPWAWWTPVRHDIRNGILEGELVSGAAIMLFANALRPHPRGRFGRLMNWLMGYNQKPDWADKAMLFLHMPNPHQKRVIVTRTGIIQASRRTSVWQYIFAFPALLLAGIPGNLLGFGWFYGIKPGILNLEHRAHLFLHGWAVTAAGGTGVGATEANLARAGFDAKVIGILGTLFFARRVFLKLGLDYQEFLAEQHASHYVANLSRGTSGRLRNWLSRPRWPQPATYRGLVWHEVTEAVETGQPVPLRNGHVMRWVILALIPAVGWLAWYGHSVLAAHGGT